MDQFTPLYGLDWLAATPLKIRHFSILQEWTIPVKSGTKRGIPLVRQIEQTNNRPLHPKPRVAAMARLITSISFNCSSASTFSLITNAGVDSGSYKAISLALLTRRRGTCKSSSAKASRTFASSAAVAAASPANILMLKPWLRMAAISAALAVPRLLWRSVFCRSTLSSFSMLSPNPDFRFY